MLRKTTIGLLSVALLPFGFAASAALFLLLLPVFALLFPVTALGGAIVSGGKLAILLFDAILGKPDHRGTNTIFTARNISLVVTQFLFIALAYIPSAAIIAAVAAIVAPLLFITSGVLASYYMSKSFVDFVVPPVEPEYTLIDAFSEKAMMQVSRDSKDEADINDKSISVVQQEPKSKSLDFFSKFRRHFDSEDDSTFSASNSPSMSLSNSKSD
ncbi:hypothetical protein BN59_00426 [Legionella massiliensis]|uniref:Uncharacterized protein n=1 Tax=Legionella massiliensis TaxID=1034943 RepID=A0A078KP51_9GAMM|nr:hypothetical protein [Legionella massiliensis]CDZ76160.1 hypothetical protein BN59_00426 [Legionella massiliensis]CEE11898.1 hypothetical protein BN1094_00426 [Legionella massiliensis]